MKPAGFVRRRAAAALLAIVGAALPAGAQTPFDIATALQALKGGLSPAAIFKRLDDFPGTPPTDPIVACQTTIRRMRALGVTSVEPLLAGCPMFERALLWEATPGELVPYSEWTVVQQGRLDDLFSWLMQQVPDLGLACPDVHEAMSTVPGVPIIYLHESEAFGIYAAHAAHVLYLEVTGRVPWSIVTVPDEELQVLLASPSYFVRALPPLYATGRTVDPAHAFMLPDRVLIGDGMICDPRVGYRFLTGRSSETGANLVRATETDTLAQLSSWMARDLGHGGAPDFAPAALRDYSYLTDRLSRRSYRSERMAYAGFGCHSATSLTLDLARSINIPLLAVRTFMVPPERWGPGGCPCHQGLLFHWTRADMRVDWHTDDLYANQLAPFFPIDEGGRPITGEAAARFFFNTTWLQPKALAARGFVIYKALRPFPRVSPPAGRHFAQPIYGTWDSPSRIDLGLLYDQRWQLCSWTTFVERGRLATLDMENAERANGPLLMAHDPSTFTPRAAACAAAYGGPEAFEALANRWIASRGSSLYVPFYLAPAFPFPPGLPWRF